MKARRFTALAASALIVPAMTVTALTVTAARPTAAGAQAAAAPAVPDMTGKILTVTGPIDPARLGHTLMHEHIFIDFTVPDDDPEKWRFAGRAQPIGATAVQFYNAPLTLDKIGAVMLGKANRDNYLLTDETQAIAEVSEFRRAAGPGATIVDVTNIGLARNPAALRRVAQATGVQVVMGASWYSKGWHPKDLDTRSTESLTEEIVRDVTVGVGDTGIRAGIIGEVGTTGKPLTPNEIKVIKASGRASRLTGAAVSLHTSSPLREQPAILDLLAEEGTDLTRVIVGHSDPIADDVPFLTGLLQRGVYIQFDLFGRPPIITRRRPTDTQVAAAIVSLIKAGHADRLLLSHDICTKTSLKAYGGTGYSFIDEMLVPYLKRQGVTDAQIETMLVENPRRVLTFVAPRPAARGAAAN